MIANGSSERHQNNTLKVIVCFGRFLGSSVSFLDISKKEQVLSFLDTKIKNSELDPEKKWINTWNDYARRIKRFLRWLYNTKQCTQNVLEEKLLPLLIGGLKLLIVRIEERGVK
jgi:hypothetical protein